MIKLEGPNTQNHYFISIILIANKNELKKQPFKRVDVISASRHKVERQGGAAFEHGRSSNAWSGTAGEPGAPSTKYGHGRGLWGFTERQRVPIRPIAFQ